MFPPNSRKVSLEALVIELGMVPENLLSAKLRCSIVGSERSILDGRLPKRELFMRIITFTVDMFKIVADTIPTRLFIPSTKASRFGRLAISWGISPGKLTQIQKISLTRSYLKYSRKITSEKLKHLYSILTIPWSLLYNRDISFSIIITQSIRLNKFNHSNQPRFFFLHIFEILFSYH